MKQTISVPASSTPQVISLTLPDQVPFSITGGTPIPAPVPDPIPTPLPTPDPTLMLIYSNNFNDKSSIDPNQLGAGGWSNTVFKDGLGSFKSLVPAGAAPISSGWRSEQQYPDTYTPDNKAIIIEYDELFEKLSSNNGLSVQWHGNFPGTSGIMSMWINDRKFMVQQNLTGAARGSNTYQQRQADGSPLMDIVLNHWYHIRWELLFSTGSNGYLRCFIDGKLYYEVKGKTTDGSGQYLKVGQNLFDHAPSTDSVMYIDNLQIWHVK